MTQDCTAICSPTGLEEMDVSSFRLVTAGVLPGCCFGTTLEIVGSGGGGEQRIRRIERSSEGDTYLLHVGGLVLERTFP